MNFLHKILVLTLIGLAIGLLSPANNVLADGTEQLGPPSIPIATGTGVVAAGVGLEEAQPADINLTVPPGATVEQVILYWSGGAIGAGNAGDNTVTVNGTSVTGTLIGGPTFFFSRASGRHDFSTYRSDITSLNVIAPGANTVSIGGMDFGAAPITENNGAGILVIIDDGSTPAEIQVRDGIDVAFIDFPAERGSTVAQTINFTVAATLRKAQIPMFFGSVARMSAGTIRPSTIVVTVAGAPTPYVNRLNSHDGSEWDTLIVDVDIPAGASSLTIQAFSRDDSVPPTGLLPASFSWLASVVVMPPTQALAALGDFVWEDLNVNGIQDPGEPPVPNVPVALLDCNTPQNVLATTTTDTNGIYGFDNLTPGCYEVRFTPPGGFTVTTRNVGSDDTVDSDADPVTGLSGQVTLVAGEINLTIDAGLWRSGPDIDVEKYTNGEDADLPTGPEVGYGDVVTWTYDIVNTGNVTLTNVTLVDNIEGGITCPLIQLIPGQSMTCVLTGIADTLGQYANTAIVTGTPTIGPTEPVTDTDPSHYLTRPFSLGNRVWLDDGVGGGVANDGVQNGGEVGIGGVLINLLDAGGLPVLGPNLQPLTAVTAADGCFLFDNLRRGDYSIEIASANFAAGQPLLNHVSSQGNSIGGLAPSPNTDIDLDDNGNDVPVNGAIRSSIVTLSLNSEPLGEALCGPGAGVALDRNSNLTVDFGFVGSVSVGDFVWFDNNQNGLQDSGEPGVPNITVRIFNANGTPATDLSGAAVPPQNTNANGLYLFGNLPPGSYYVVFDRSTLPAGFTITTPNVGADDTIDSDANPSTGQTAPTPFLFSGVQDLNLDMGLLQLQGVRVGDYVWVDANLNGRQEVTETGVSSVTVTLFDAATDQQVAVTQTAANGLYLFANLAPGQYYVVFNLATLPPGYQVTTPNASGVPDDLDSDADPITGRTPNTPPLAAGQEDLTLDMGVFILLSVGNQVWLDQGAPGNNPNDPLLNNGLFDRAVESGLPNIPVRLFTVGGTLVATTTTDVSGTYRFNGLLPGEYIVEIDVLAGYVSSTGGPPGMANPPFEPAPDPDNDVDDDDNGTGQANPQTIRTFPVTLSIGDEPAEGGNYNDTVDFGVCQDCTELQQVAALGDFVWFDEVCDGIQDAASVPVQNVTVRLFKATGELVGTQLTNAQGEYLFTQLEPGQYFVEFVRPPQFVFATPKQGNDIEVDSDAASVAPGSLEGRSETIVLVGGQTDPSWDAGLCNDPTSLPGEEEPTLLGPLFLPFVRR